MEAGGVKRIAAAARARRRRPFLINLYAIVDDQRTDKIVSWSGSGDSFIVKDLLKFSRCLLPLYFNHRNFDSFKRQLNNYGFKKVSTDRLEYANEGFLRGQRHLLTTIKRRSSSHSHGRPYPPLALTETIEERSKREGNVLMEELLSLKSELVPCIPYVRWLYRKINQLNQHVLYIETLLEKAMQRPRFVAPVVHQQNDSKRHISGANKKRRLPNQDEKSLARKYGKTSPDGQTVECQPLMNVAEMAEPRQIQGMNHPPSYVLDGGSSSKRISGVTLSNVLLDATTLTKNGFSTDNMHPPSNVLESGTSSHTISRVALLEGPPSTSALTEKGFSIDNMHPSSSVLECGSSSNRISGGISSKVLPNTAALTEIQSSSGSAHGNAHTTVFPQASTIAPDFSPALGLTPEKNTELCEDLFSGAENIDSGCEDTNPGSFYASTPASDEPVADDDCDDFSREIDELLGIDDTSDLSDDDFLLETGELPGIDDFFGQQFFSNYLLTEDTYKISTVNLGDGTSNDHLKEQEGNEMK